MKKIILSALAISAFVFTSCGEDKPAIDKPVKVEVEMPATYEFSREGESTVSYSGQVARLQMASELKDALGKGGVETSTLESLNNMFAEGTGFSDFDTKGKKLRETVASGSYSILADDAKINLREKMDGWIKNHAEVVIPAVKIPTDASNGVAGILDGKRLVDANGIEANQAVAKTMIGAIMLDQCVNKYISQQKIDDTKEGNSNLELYKEGANYTKLEHAWDEAYGYVFGQVNGKTAFLGKYLASVDGNANFAGIMKEVEDSFKLGRAAIVAKRYDVVAEEAAKLRANLSKVVAVKLAHYLLKGKGPKNGSTLHALSEGYGFAHAMMFAHAAGQQAGDKVSPLIDALEAQSLWVITDATLDNLANQVASYYGFKATDAL